LWTTSFYGPGTVTYALFVLTKQEILSYYKACRKKAPQWQPTKKVQKAKSMKIAAILIIALITFVGPAKANPITYTLTAVGSGSLGSEYFTNETFTITSTADTANITESTGYSSISTYIVPDTTSAVSVDGLATATFTVPSEEVALSVVGDVAIQAPSQINDTFSVIVLGAATSGLNSYNLNTSIGPLSGSPQINSGIDFSTTAGNFDLTSVTSDTFQAQVVPEPDSLAPLGLGALFLGYKRKKFWQ
jgi:hypothetical protein